MNDREAAEFAAFIAAPAAAKLRRQLGPANLDHLGIRAEGDEVLVRFSKTSDIVFNPLLAVGAALAILEAVKKAAKEVK